MVLGIHNPLSTFDIILNIPHHKHNQDLTTEQSSQPSRYFIKLSFT